MNGNAAQAISAENNTPQTDAPFANSDKLSEAISIYTGEKEIEDDGETVTRPKETEEDSFSKKFSEIAKIETKYQGEIRKLKEKIDHLTEGSQNKFTKEELLSEIKEEFNRNPRAFLEDKFESSYDNLSDFILNEETRVQDNETKSLINSLKEEIDSLKNERNEEKQSQKSQELQEKERAFKDNIKNHVSEKEEFALVDSLELNETVFDVMMNYFNENGKMMDINEACAQVENYYVKELEKVAHLPKVKKLLNLDNTNDNQNNDSNDFFESSKTLTNDDNYSSSTKNLEEMSLDERMKLAASML